eukprot:XP_011684089.1 PREDICTED: probable serine/threonine-protein kinase roco11 [Strongylocentrotus purpuratus]
MLCSRFLRSHCPLRHGLIRSKASVAAQKPFIYQDVFEPDHARDTPFKKLTSDFVSTIEVEGRKILRVKPEALTMLASQAMIDIAHLLRPKHLQEIGAEGVSLSIWDFAGHDIYYSTHQVFLTWRAIYVIVFDLSRRLDEVVPPESRDKNYEMVKGGAKSELTCLEFINFWLYSIYAHAVAPSSVITKNMSKPDQESPPIFIVGTHRESLKGDAQEKKDQIDSAFKEIRESIIGKPFQRHVVSRYFAIENSLEDEDKETKKLMQQIGMESKSELLTMLTFYHDLGNVVYYGGIKDQQSLLRDMVILNPQWLIDVFKQVITILDPEKRDGIVCDAWNTLEKDGILEDRLIQHMWQSFLEKKETLVELMAKFDLICEAPVERRQQEQQDGVDTKCPFET